MTVLKSRLHKPIISSNFIYRERIVELLNESYEKPLILVSAPAGYGKSAAVSQWLDMQEKSYSWLSISNDFNNLGVFLEYFAEALSRFGSPQKKNSIHDIVKASSVLNPQAIAEKVCNYLIENSTPGILVLDDYHYINNETIHELMNHILAFPPLNKQLVVIARFDPPFRLNQHRFYGKLLELRMSDLMIDSQEFQSLLKIQKSELSSNSSMILERSEGWILGISMLFHLHRKGKQNMENLLTSNMMVNMEFLLEEYLSLLPKSLNEPLLLTSICDRFNIDLLERLFQAQITQKVNVPEFIAKLKKYNLFLIEEDDVGEWYRFHHLFGRLLRKRQERIATDNYDSILRLVSAWFASNDYIDEAIAYVLRNGDLESAASLVAHHRRDVFNKGQWWRVKAWLDRFPDNFIKTKPSLLISHVWVLENIWDLQETQEALYLLKNVIKDDTDDMEASEYFYHLSFHTLFFHSSPGEALKYALKSKKLYYDGEMIGAQREMVLAFCMQMLDQTTQAIKMLEKTEKKYSNGSLMHLRSFSSRLFVLLLSSEFIEAKYVSRRFDYVVKNTFRNMEAWSSYLAANIDFQYFEPQKVNMSLLKAVNYEGALDWRAFMDCYAGVCINYIIQNDITTAKESLKRMKIKSQQIKDGLFFHLYISTKMRMYWLQGEHQKPIDWAMEERDLDMKAVDPLFAIEFSPLTRIRILVTFGNGEWLRHGLNLLRSFENFVHSIYNSYHDIDIMLLRALAHMRLKNNNESVVFVKKAFELYNGQRITRPFRELMLVAPSLFDGVDDIPLNLQHIISTKPKSTKNIQISSKYRGNHLANLTRREKEIAKLVCQGLLNKEIADHLHISTATVKSHLTNIYGKLNVRNRTSMISIVQIINHNSL